MKHIGKLASNDTSNIGIIPSASKYFSIKSSDQCIHILNNKDRLNGLKDSTKFKIDNHYSNINHVYTIFKGTLVLITEVRRCDGITNCFHH